MNDRHRRVMCNMKRDDPKRYLWANLKAMVSGAGMSAEEICAAIAIMTKKKRKPIKWHKSNKGWK